MNEPLRAAIKADLTALVHLTPEDWDERRGADPIARTINAARDIVDARCAALAVEAVRPALDIDAIRKQVIEDIEEADRSDESLAGPDAVGDIVYEVLRVALRDAALAVEAVRPETDIDEAVRARVLAECGERFRAMFPDLVWAWERYEREWAVLPVYRATPEPGFYCIDCNEVLPFPSSDVAAVNAHLAADLADPTGG